MQTSPTLTERDREESAVREEARYDVLFAELSRALLNCDVGCNVSAPGRKEGEATAADLAMSEVSGSDDLSERTAYILGLAATQKQDAALQTMALRLIKDICHAHADGRSGISRADEVVGLDDDEGVVF